MSYRKLIPLLFAITSMISYADDRRDRLRGIIDEEMKEVVRLSRAKDHRDPGVLLRISELYLEKARLTKEVENERFLKIPAKKRARLKRSRYFGESNKLFRKAQNTAKAILKKFKKFRGRNQVYYVLAYNAKEFGKVKTARNYFRLASKYSFKGKDTDLKAKLALAELHFNEQNFRKAIPLYEFALSKKKEKWWTKDSYNLAWAYYKTRKYNKAIKKLREVIKYSSSENYIDMGQQGKKDLALFYVSAGRIDDAISYYKSDGGRVSEKLLKMGQHLMDQEKFTTAETVLNEVASVKPPREDLIKSYSLLLKLYEKYSKYQKHLNISQKMYGLHQKQALSDDMLTVLIFQTKKMGAVLQKQIIKGPYKNVKGAKEKKGQMASKYFEILATLESKEDYKSLFHSAETNYAIKQYDNAAALYDKAYIAAAQRKQKKFQLAALEGLLAALSQRGVKKETEKKYLIVAYDRFLKINSRSRKANKIFQRSFNFHFANKDINSAEETLIRYKNAQPKQAKTQEAMIAKIMDHYKNTGEMVKFRSWVSRISSGEFRVSQRYAKSLKAVLLTMQFESVEQASSKGDKLRALRGYMAIFNDIKSTPEAKVNAAYNTSILFHELSDVDRSYQWLSRSLALMKLKDLQKFEETYFQIMTEQFNRQRFQNAINLFSDFFSKTCGTKIKKKNLIFKNLYIIYLAQKQVNEAIKLIDQGQKCDVRSSFINSGRQEIIKILTELNKWDDLNTLVTGYYKKGRFLTDLVVPFAKLREVSLKNGRFEDAKYYTNVIEGIFKKKRYNYNSFSVEALDVYAANKLVGLEREIQAFKNLRLRFPENTYDRLLKKKLKLLDEITTEAVKVLKIGSGKGIVKAYQYLVETYQVLAKEVQDFTPPGKSSEYITSFKNNMDNIVNAMIGKSKDFINEAKKQIEKNNILSKNNYWFYSQVRLPLLLEYKYSKSGILMDRGGKP